MRKGGRKKLRILFRKRKKRAERSNSFLTLKNGNLSCLDPAEASGMSEVVTAKKKSKRA